MGASIVRLPGVSVPNMIRHMSKGAGKIRGSEGHAHQDDEGDRHGDGGNMRDGDDAGEAALGPKTVDGDTKTIAETQATKPQAAPCHKPFRPKVIIRLR